jgi:hypothetical protein
LISVYQAIKQSPEPKFGFKSYAPYSLTLKIVELAGKMHAEVENKLKLRE